MIENPDDMRGQPATNLKHPDDPAPHPGRWAIAIMVSAAIVLSYLDRLTLPWTLSEIQKDYPFSDQVKALFDSAFLISYGLMYLGGGRLLDRLGTRRGFLIVMIFWSLACASQGLAGNFGMPAIGGMAFALCMLVVSRFLLGAGEGGGFPAATRAVTEWFPVNERSTAMGIINAGTAVGAVAAPPLIVLVLNHTGWFGISPWRWVFIICGAMGLLWTLWWFIAYHPPEEAVETDDGSVVVASKPAAVPIKALLRHKEVWAVVGAKFLTDAAWYFYMFWLPKFLMEMFDMEFSSASGVGWIPYAAAGVGCLVGGCFSSALLKRGASVNMARKLTLGLSAAFMPWVMLVPQLDSVTWVIVVFSLAFFGQQSWSTLVMILPTDMIPRHSVGTVAGMVGLGGALGGVVLGQTAGYLRDHGFSYTPILIVAGSLHIIAFILICVVVPRIRQLDIQPQTS